MRRASITLVGLALLLHLQAAYRTLGQEKSASAVRGKVTESERGLITFSIPKSSGIRKGDTVHVWRADEKTKHEYITSLSVLIVEDDKSLGNCELGKVKAGDVVVFNEASQHRTPPPKEQRPPLEKVIKTKPQPPKATTSVSPTEGVAITQSQKASFVLSTGARASGVLEYLDAHRVKCIVKGRKYSYNSARFVKVVTSEGSYIYNRERNIFEVEGAEAAEPKPARTEVAVAMPKPRVEIRIPARVAPPPEPPRTEARPPNTPPPFVVEPEKARSEPQPSAWKLGEIREFSGHADAVRSVAFSPDGRIAASGGKESSVRLWDVASGEEIGQLRGHEYPVMRIAFPPGGQSVITYSADELDLGDLTFERLTQREAKNLVSKKDTLRSWDLKTRKEMHNFGGTKSYFNDIVVSPDGRTLFALGFDDVGITLFDIGTGKMTGKMSATLQEVRDLEIGRTFGARRRLVDWSRTNLAEPDYRADSLTLSWDGKWALTAGRGGVMRLWDVEKRTLCQTFDIPEEYVAGVAFIPGSNRTVVAQYDFQSNGLGFSNPSTGNWVGGLFLTGNPRLWILGNGPYYGNRIAALPDGRRVVVASKYEGDLKDVKKFFGMLFGDEEDRKRQAEVKTKSGLHVFDIQAEKETDTFITTRSTCCCLAVSKDGWLALTGHGDNTVCLWGLPPSPR